MDQTAKPDGNTVNAADSTGAAQIDAQELFRGRQQIHIVHGDEIYCLRITKNNKLILNK